MATGQTSQRRKYRFTNELSRPRVIAAVLAVCGAAALATAAGSAAASPTITAHVRSSAAATNVPVIIDCTMHARIRPSQYILACADGNAAVTRLQWAAWGSSAAFASGTSVFNDCVPSCVAGHLHSFAILGALWRAEPRPGHPGQRYFTRLTLIYTGSRTYRAGGKTYHLPQTATYPLSAAGGV